MRNSEKFKLKPLTIVRWTYERSKKPIQIAVNSLFSGKSSTNIPANMGNKIGDPSSSTKSFSSWLFYCFIFKTNPIKYLYWSYYCQRISVFHPKLKRKIRIFKLFMIYCLSYRLFIQFWFFNVDVRSCIIICSYS